MRNNPNYYPQFFLDHPYLCLIVGFILASLLLIWIDKEEKRTDNPYDMDEAFLREEWFRKEKERKERAVRKRLNLTKS